VRKQDLASVVATETKLTPRRAEQIINVTLKAIENALLDGDSVTLTGFGTLKLVDRQGRTRAPGRRFVSRHIARLALVRAIRCAVRLRSVKCPWLARRIRCLVSNSLL
jgi:nucleoid DNA-binding protein